MAWCIDSEGRKHLLHLAVGNKESEAAWTGFFRNLIERGMRLPTTVTTDGAPGMIKAVEVVFPTSVRVRCWFHRLSNIRSKLPDDEAAEVMAHIYAVRDAPTLDAARAAADRFENTYRRQFPAAVACFADDREALLAIHRVPVRHRIRVRTTNLAERSFEEERRRTKVIPRLMSEKATMKLAFATMIRSAERWCRGLGERHRTPPAQAAPGRARARPAACRGSLDDPKENNRAPRGMTLVTGRFTGRSGLDLTNRSASTRIMTPCSSPLGDRRHPFAAGAGRPSPVRPQLPQVDASQRAR